MSAHKVRLLIDSGSQLSFVTEHLVNQLRLARYAHALTIKGIGGAKAAQTHGVTRLTLRSTHSTKEIELEVHILPKVSATLPSAPILRGNWPHLKKLHLADPGYCQPQPIDIIVGADFYGSVIEPDMIKASPSMPVAQSSIFGWIVLGRAHSAGPHKITAHHVAAQKHDDLQELLTRFWTQEEPPLDLNPHLTPEEQECENHFIATHERDVSGRYVVRLPLKLPAEKLGLSRKTASQCLKRITRRCKLQPTYGRLYNVFLEEYEKLGHMVRISNDHQPAQPHFYLPHHGVLKPSSTTTKLRVVFNGSSLTSSGKSLNDILHTGANLLPNIVDVLTWIRLPRHLFATDIVKMYRQVKVHPDDWPLQQILWHGDNDEEITFQLTTLTYGTKPAGFLATRALLQLVQDEGYKFPLAVQSLTEGRYVDDIFGGADTVDILINTAHQLTSLCKAGGFPLSKWHATHPDLLKAVAQNPLDSSITFDDCETKLLGLNWIPHEDKFTFSSSLKDAAQTLTKRTLLSEIAKIFDPLGFASPVTVRAKVLIQDLWSVKLGFDDPIPTHLTLKWIAIRDDLKALNQITVPRWFNTWSYSSIELHGFADASQLAMAAVVYLVVHSPSTGSRTSFICAKTKVAPLKKLTIPRLELTAALLLAKLISHLRTSFKLKIDATHLWTDSRVTLAWVNSHANRWKDYVRNRVIQIQELCAHSTWRHVPGGMNPADCGSRGVSTDQLVNHQLWWTGPQWIAQPKENWPAQPEITLDETNPEARPGITLLSSSAQPTYQWDLICKYSSLPKLLNVTTLVFRAIPQLLKRLCKNPLKLCSQLPYILDPCHQKSMLFWVKVTQAVYFQHEIRMISRNARLPSSHPFARLTAFIDQDGVIRVGGRLHNSSLMPESKHSFILPRKSQLTDLIIDYAHRNTLHGGTQLTLAKIRQNCWIIGGRAPVKAHILRCVVCARQRGERAQQLMSRLPIPRVTPSRAFLHTAVDYAGPISIKNWKGRGSKVNKGWICAFVCLSTSAAHLEIVSDYSSDAFIAAFHRLISRRGLVSDLYSDCGTTFVGADKEIRKLFTASSSENQLIRSMAQRDGLKWHFNPPASPHMGGKWEALIKSVKFHLRRTVGDALLTFEEYYTLLTQIESVLNSRPLEPLSDDPDDVEALTPGHFLIGAPLNSLPEPSIIELQSSRLKNWQLIQQRLQCFWKNWSAHYLHRLQTISKWHYAQNEITPGKLVLLTDERMPPGKWPMARVIDVHPSKDGLTRIVTIKTSTTTLTRPIVKLVPLPVPPLNER